MDDTLIIKRLDDKVAEKLRLLRENGVDIKELVSLAILDYEKFQKNAA